jgi:hypothetical protein
MAKEKALPKPLEFPPNILVKLVKDGDDSYFVAGTEPSDLPDDSDTSIKTARYVLAGTGVISYSAARYVEDAKA